MTPSSRRRGWYPTFDQPAGVKVGYEYDFGASWQHEITSQKAFMLNPDQLSAWRTRATPRSSTPSEEDPREPEPFSLTEVNRKLARLGR